MLKLLSILTLVGILAAGILYLRPLYIPTQTPVKAENPPTPSKPSNPQDKIKTLEEKLSTIETRLTTLEDSTSNLQKTIDKISGAPIQTSTQIIYKKSTQYIPIGSSGGTGDRNFVSIDSFEASIDPIDYEGYTSMQLEVSLRLVEKVGTVYARLFNATDQKEIGSSEVSTASDKFTFLTSPTFKLPDGRKTYRVQLKSTQGYDTFIQNTRIKVNY